MSCIKALHTEDASEGLFVPYRFEHYDGTDVSTATANEGGNGGAESGSSR